jgi:hypothetical protein
MDSKSPPRWYQFSLRTLLIITTLACVTAAGGSLMMRSRHYREEAVYHRSHLDDAKFTRHHEHVHGYHLNAAEAYEQAALLPWLSPSFSRVPPKVPPEIPRSWIEMEDIYDEMSPKQSREK